MEILSLSRQTDLIFSEFEGEICHRKNYIAVKTRSNPGYHWGNYLIFESLPDEAAVEQWPEIFRREFDYYEAYRHMLFTWNPGSTEQAVIELFQKQGFEFQRNLVLSTSQLNPPKKMNNEIKIRPFQAMSDWEQSVRLHILCSDPTFGKKSFELFKRRQFETYQKMIAAGMGNRFGAFIGNQLVADLGLFHRNGLARYQNVITHPEYRKRGICSTLVFFAGKIALEKWGVYRLVMEADPEYHAARIYESLGFRPTEENHCLTWWKHD